MSFSIMLSVGKYGGFYQTECAEVPYNKKDGAKYQNQSGAVMSRFYQNKRE